MQMENELEVLDFAGLWDIIQCRFTKHLYNRHIIAINRICKQRPNGIFLDELAQYTKLLKLCKDHLENNREEFLTPIINLLCVTLQPYITEKSFEKIEYFDTIKQHFELVSHFLSLKYTFITITICKGIKKYICDVLDYKVINSSGIVDELVDVLRSWCYGARWKIEDNHNEIKNKNQHILNIELSLHLIAVIKVLSFSEQCIITLVNKCDILDLKILYDCQQNDMFLTHSIELLWNIIEISPFELVTEYIKNDYFNIFKSLLTKYMKEIEITNKENDKQLRNCVLSIILILSKHESMHKYFERSHIINILLKCCHLIITQNNQNNYQDFQLLCIIFNIIHRTCKCYRILSVLLEQKFIDNIIDTLFNPNNRTNKWTATQLINIRIELIFMFQTLIQIIPKYFFENKIINKLFHFFVYHQQSISHHHAINKHIDIVSKSLLRLFAKSLHAICREKYNLTLSNPAIIESMQEIVNMDHLCDELLKIVNHVSYEQVTRTDSVLIISYFSTLNSIKDNKYNDEYAPNIIKYICILLNILPSKLKYYQDFQHSLIKCLKNILNKQENECMFLHQNGITILINIIEKSEISLIENAMALLLQLSSNTQFVQKIQSIFDENINFQSILFNVWDKCELDVTNQMNLRIMTSIYCLYSKLRSFFYSQNINADQQHKITKILNHPQLIQGQEWQKLQQELNEEAVELITFDKNKLTSHINKYNKIKSQLLSAEKSLKIVANKKLDENLKDLMNKLHLYKSQKVGGKHSIRHRKENVFSSTIKLNKDQKDAIVAKSLQLDETMKNVLGE